MVTITPKIYTMFFWNNQKVKKFWTIIIVKITTIDMVQTTQVGELDIFLDKTQVHYLKPNFQIQVASTTKIHHSHSRHLVTIFNNFA